MKIITAFLLSLAAAYAAEPIPVVTTFDITADWIRQVGGDRVSVTALATDGADPHHFRPTPRHAALIEDSKLVVLIGAGFDESIEKLAHDHKAILELVDAIKSDITAHDDHEEHDDHGDEKHDDRGHEKHDDHGHEKHDDHGHEKHDDHGHEKHDDHGHEKHDDHGHEKHDEHGHEKHEGHGGEIEWAGAFTLEPGTYQWSFAKVAGEYADPAMKMLFMATEAEHPIEAKEADSAKLYKTEGKALAAGGTLSAGTLHTVQFDQAKDITFFSITIAQKGTYVFFTEHMPYEFEANEHFLKNAKGEDIEPIAEAPEAGEGHHHHHHGGEDPHIWLDPIKVIAAVHEIEEKLAQLDPAHAKVYAKNAEAYIAEITALDLWIKQQVATIPEKHRILVTGHDAYRHFTDRYGFEVGATILGLSTEAADPSAKQLGELADKVKAAGVPTVFGEKNANNKLMQSLAREAGVKVGKDLQPESLGPKGSETGTYLGLMKTNVSVIVEGLAP